MNQYFGNIIKIWKGQKFVFPEDWEEKNQTVFLNQPHVVVGAFLSTFGVRTSQPRGCGRSSGQLLNGVYS